MASDTKVSKDWVDDVQVNSTFLITKISKPVYLWEVKQFILKKALNSDETKTFNGPHCPVPFTVEYFLWKQLKISQENYGFFNVDLHNEFVLSMCCTEVIQSLTLQWLAARRICRAIRPAFPDEVVESLLVNLLREHFKKMFNVDVLIGSLVIHMNRKTRAITTIYDKRLITVGMLTITKLSGFDLLHNYGYKIQNEETLQDRMLLNLPFSDLVVKPKFITPIILKVETGGIYTVLGFIVLNMLKALSLPYNDRHTTTQTLDMLFCKSELLDQLHHKIDQSWAKEIVNKCCALYENNVTTKTELHSISVSQQIPVNSNVRYKAVITDISKIAEKRVAEGLYAFGE